MNWFVVHRRNEEAQLSPPTSGAAYRGAPWRTWPRAWSMLRSRTRARALVFQAGKLLAEPSCMCFSVRVCCRFLLLPVRALMAPRGCCRPKRSFALLYKTWCTLSLIGLFWIIAKWQHKVDGLRTAKSSCCKCTKTILSPREVVTSKIPCKIYTFFCF